MDDLLKSFNAPRQTDCPSVESCQNQLNEPLICSGDSSAMRSYFELCNLGSECAHSVKCSDPSELFLRVHDAKISYNSSFDDATIRSTASEPHLAELTFSVERVPATNDALSANILVRSGTARVRFIGHRPFDQIANAPPSEPIDNSQNPTNAAGSRRIQVTFGSFPVPESDVAVISCIALVYIESTILYIAPLKAVACVDTLNSSGEINWSENDSTLIRPQVEVDEHTCWDPEMIEVQIAGRKITIDDLVSLGMVNRAFDTNILGRATDIDID